MKTVRYHSYGDSDVLVHEDTDRPVAGPGQVVLRVAGTAFNALDAAIRGGLLREPFPVSLPHVPNYDVAGVVEEVGEGVHGWSAGDAAVAFLPPLTAGGAAEYVAAPAEVLAAAPRRVQLADAAALPSVGLAAWQALFEHAGLKAGQSVLVDGGGGAVGGYAVQLAKQAGITVTASAGPRSHDRVRSYGADRIVDHTAAPVPQALAGQRFDAVLHLAPAGPDLATAGPQELAQLADLVADGGAFVSLTTPGPQDVGRGVRAVRVFTRSDAAQLSELVGRVDAGTLRIDVAERRPLADLAAVHALAAAGRLPGKTVLIPA
ncbi:NADP-dependent oxidoreductase [Streptomyces cocklensis]|uniref:NADPH:quinone reductase-like Zn-dependent oxidoreductase n=1 Tax=Actinacidiphila cocklensis TaxID=887465 RepID=A0A9W4GXP4_9ACTN|nr:NADP-dependent oxidoreductase [Actinacidiphila cocklensis]MDD1058836.1 NADP-dependent oxidoreductase [Actinacidiphila cocklensis]WSX74965.1 NADP-dependent oxidoreductase [Streptomyces sp. NBC_00899]CAG6398965.1 NADPH:quinone reductase-like Zn-dependent oxidoreductase [Actinacidiphila cocklensis]